TRTDPGQTDVVVAGTLGVHRATTEHVVLRSRWVDQVDDPAADKPGEQGTKRIVADVQIPTDGDGDSEIVAATSLQLGDTRRRVVELVAEGFCRFSRYFTERLDFLAGDPGAALALHDGGVVPASVALTRLDDGTRLARGGPVTLARGRTPRSRDTAPGARG